MLTLPNGERHWPLVSAYQFRKAADIRQYQVIQRALDNVEVKLVIEQPLSAPQEAQLTAIIQQALGHAFPLRFSYSPQELPNTRSGKFEDFISLV